MKSHKTIILTSLVMAVLFLFTYFYRYLENWLYGFHIPNGVAALMIVVISLAILFLISKSHLEKVSYMAARGTFVIIGIISIYMSNIRSYSAGFRTWIWTIALVLVFLLLAIIIERRHKRNV